MKTNIDDTAVQIKRSDDAGLDDIFGYSAQDVENESRIKVVDSGNLSSVLKEFINYLDLTKKGIFCQSIDESYILTPSEILSFFYITENYNSYDNFSYIFQLFANGLIQNSYDNGNNNFELDLTNNPTIHSLGNLCGREDNPIIMNVFGDVGVGFASNAEYLDVAIKGDADIYFGERSKFVKALIRGNVSSSFGILSKKLTALIVGSSRQNILSGSTESTIFLTGSLFGDYYSSKSNSLYRNDEVLKFSQYHEMEQELYRRLKE